MISHTILLFIILIIVVAILILLKRALFGKKSSDGQSQIYVGNLPYRLREQELRSQFEKYGDVRQIRIVKNRATGRSKGFAFVTYKNSNQAQQALGAHGTQLQGRSLVVRIAKKKDD